MKKPETLLTGRVVLPKPFKVWWYPEQSVAVRATVVAILLDFPEVHYELQVGDDTFIVPELKTSTRPLAL